MISMISESFASILATDQPRNVAELNRCFETAAHEVGAQAMTYFTWHVGEAKLADRPRIETTYPSAWKARYQECRYERIDPVVRHGMTAILPLDWASVANEGPEARKLFGEAAEYGLHRHGLSVPIRDACKRQALFSINFNISDRDWETFLGSLRSDLVYTAYLYHSQFIELSSSKTSKLQLSPREQEVLQWAANGKTSWETALILDLSTKTVDFYMSKICTKLGVANRVQAVAAAVARGYIVAT